MLFWIIFAIAANEFFGLCAILSLRFDGACRLGMDSALRTLSTSQYVGSVLLASAIWPYFVFGFFIDRYKSRRLAKMLNSDEPSDQWKLERIAKLREEVMSANWRDDELVLRDNAIRQLDEMERELTKVERRARGE